MPLSNYNIYAEYLIKHFLALGSDSTTPSGFYSTSSTLSSNLPGPLFRLKPGTDAAMPSINGVIAQNLLRLSALFEDESYRLLAKQTCHAFAVEIMQHPFLFVGLLDAIVSLEVGVKSVTGVVGHSGDFTTSTDHPSDDRSRRGKDGASVIEAIVGKVHEEAGPATSSCTTVSSLIDVRVATINQPMENKTMWLRQRNPLLRDIQPGMPGKNFLLVCEAGLCRTVDI